MKAKIRIHIFHGVSLSCCPSLHSECESSVLQTYARNANEAYVPIRYGGLLPVKFKVKKAAAQCRSPS